MRRLCWLSLLLAGCGSSAALVPSPTLPECTRARESLRYEVYSAAIDFHAGSGSYEGFVVSDETGTGMLFSPGAALDVRIDQMFRSSPAPGLATDFASRNASPSSITARFTAETPLRVEPKDEVYAAASAGQRDGWSSFVRAYPGFEAYVSLTGVGASSGCQEAAVCLETGCGGLCGEGVCMLLVDDGPQWRVVAITGIWIS